MTFHELLDSDMATLVRHACTGLDWWIGELHGLLPERLTRGGKRRAWHRYEKGAVITASASRADTLIVPTNLCLVRTLTLPRMGRADLAALVALDLDRIMPVTPESIVTGVAVAGPTADGKGLLVRVGAMARKDAITVASAIDSAGITPRHIGTLNENGTLAFDLAPAMRQAALLPLLSPARRFWWSMVTLLALANLGIAVLRDQQQAAHMQDLVDAQAPALGAVRRIEGRLHENARRVIDLDARRRQHQPLRLLGALDAALPDQAWIQRLEWDGQHTRLSGFAGADVNVVAALKQSGRFVGVRANRAEAMTQDRTGRPFDLTATLPEPMR